MIIYTESSNFYVFYSWNDNASGDVGRLDAGGTTFDDDYMSTIPTGGATLGRFPHPLWEGSNGILYIGDGASIHKFDGLSSTFGASAIDNL